jgi:hypothetical protein
VYLDAQDCSVPLDLSDLFGPFDLDLTGEDEREGEAHSGWGSGKVRRRRGQGWSSATDMVASGEDGPDDDARGRMAKAMVSTACLHSCCSDDEGRLEMRGATVCSGRGRPC